ncbi:hypothetical protein [Reyranella sp.]|uniref:hypothetical protein n=1 Tax=Reyranella sp. TaxID=1929291 RepID=UPI00378316D0
MSTTADPVAATTSAAADAFQGYAAACSEWQQEIARFLGRRLTANRDTLEALAASRDVAGVMRAQQQWGLQLATDYMHEAGRVMRLFTALSLTGATPDAQATARIIG